MAIDRGSGVSISGVVADSSSSTALGYAQAAIASATAAASSAAAALASQQDVDNNLHAPIVQSFTIGSDGTTLVSGITAYIVGTNALEVTLNGIDQTGAYSETSTTSITFSEGLLTGDVVVVRQVNKVPVGTLPATAIPYSGRTVSDKLGDIVSVKDFGAKGDGVTDDTAAIQNALNAYPNGATIFFPRGTYKLGSSITIKGKSKLIGDGAENTIITSTAAITMFVATAGTNYITVDGFTFSANGITTNCLDLSYVTNAVVHSCHFQNLAGFYGFGVKLQSGATSNLVGYWAQITGNAFNSLDKCIFAPNGDTNWGGGNDAYIAFNTFTNQYNYGVYLGTNVSDAYILANDFAGAQYCEIFAAWFGTKISMNKFENNANPLPATHLGYNIVLDTTSGGTLSFFNRNTGIPGLIQDKAGSNTTNTIFETNLTQWPASNNASVNFGNISIGVDSFKRTIQAASGFNLILKAVSGGAVSLDGDGGVIWNKSGSQVGSITTNVLNNNGSHWYIGNGNPNTVVTGIPGDFYTNTAGGSATTLWVKESGTGNTGWVGK